MHSNKAKSESITKMYVCSCVKNVCSYKHFVCNNVKHVIKICQTEKLAHYVHYTILIPLAVFMLFLIPLIR